MRGRLIELLNASFEEQYEKRMLLTAQHTADALLAAGIVLPPCKVGQTVYVPWEWEGQKGIASPIVECIQIVRDTKLCGFFIDTKSDDAAFNDVYGFWRTFSDIGKTIFLTKEEAERALAERREG